MQRAVARLSIVTVDEPIYRRLPAFLIATVDSESIAAWTTGRSAGRAPGSSGMSDARTASAAHSRSHTSWIVRA